MKRCPHCGHDPEKPSGQSGLMAMTSDAIDWRLVMWLAIFIAAVVLVLAGVHDGVLRHG